MPYQMPDVVTHARPLLDGGSLLFFGAGLAGGLTRLPWWAVLGIGIGAKVVARKTLNSDEGLAGAVVDMGALMSGFGITLGVRDLGLLERFGYPAEHQMLAEET
jgi:hypothetical protein